jgi:hypothetical protein
MMRANVVLLPGRFSLWFGPRPVWATSSDVWLRRFVRTIPGTALWQHPRPRRQLP